ncbi:MAG: hypothetical protein ACE5EX_11125, partial [Phycisphaerae bacterium]
CRSLGRRVSCAADDDVGHVSGPSNERHGKGHGTRIEFRLTPRESPGEGFPPERQGTVTASR